MTVCVYWCESSTYCCKLLVAKVMADVQQSAYSWHLSILLSVRITHSQSLDRLSIPLMEELKTTGNKDQAAWKMRWECVYWGKEKERERRGLGKWQRENCSSAQGFVLHSSDLAPERSFFQSFQEGRISVPFVSFLFGSLVSYLYIHLCRHWCLRREPWSASH